MVDCVTSWVIIVLVDYEQIYILCCITILSILWNLYLVAQIINCGNCQKFLPPNLSEVEKGMREKYGRTAQQNDMYQLISFIAL